MPSSSSSSDLDSSSSSLEEILVDIEHVVVSQNNFNLIPFTFIGEKGTTEEDSDGSQLNFVIKSKSGLHLEYSDLINRDNSLLTTVDSEQDSTVYVPQDEQEFDQHSSSFYVDVIAKDIDGIRSVRTHVESEAYDFEDIDDSDHLFTIPKFTWENDRNTFLPDYLNSVWVGQENGYINKIGYTSDSASVTDFNLIGSIVNSVLTTDRINSIYVSAKDDLKIVQSTRYLEEDNSTDLLADTNDNKDSMSFYDEDAGIIWSVRSIEGHVVKLNKDDLSEIATYQGMDGPFKIVKSNFHNAFFVAGNNILWKIDDNAQTVTPVYEVNDYSIEDIDVSDAGEICILLRSINDDILRILDNDLYSFIANEGITGNSFLRFCKYTGDRKFYILAESGTRTTEASQYSTTHYIFDLDKKTFDSEPLIEEASTTTTTTTFAPTATPVVVEAPNGGETVVLGEQYEIKWSSNQSIDDVVKIELYKAGVLNSVIVEETKNDGVYLWDVPSDVERDIDYTICITWLTASSDPGNVDYSDADFTISDTSSETTTTTTTASSEQAVGIVHDKDNNLIVIALESGFISLFSLDSRSSVGLFATGENNITSIAMGNENIDTFRNQSKARVFVGSQEGWSDKWDSGIVETELLSMYYGGGDNLESGERYYVHIQVYSENNGWSDVQVKTFVMPK
jgi:hypothetical protein